MFISTHHLMEWLNKQNANKKKSKWNQKLHGKSINYIYALRIFDWKLGKFQKRRKKIQNGKRDTIEWKTVFWASISNMQFDFFYRFKREMYVNIFQLIILPQSISWFHSCAVWRRQKKWRIRERIKAIYTEKEWKSLRLNQINRINWHKMIIWALILNYTRYFTKSTESCPKQLLRSHLIYWGCVLVYIIFNRNSIRSSEMCEMS